MNSGLCHSLQKNKILVVFPASEIKQTILKEAFKEIGTCRNAIKINRIAIKEGLVFDESLFFEVNLFREF